MWLSQCSRLTTSTFLKSSFLAFVRNSLPKNDVNLLTYRLFSSPTTRLCAQKTANESNSTPKSSAGKQLKETGRSYLEEVLIKPKDEPKTTAEKVKKGIENTFFYSVCAASVAALMCLGYFLLEYFWAADSPQRIYANAIKLIRNDDRCLDLFGTEIAAYGEDSGRGRRRHIANKRYIKDGVEHVRVVFHIKGENRVGRAIAEVAKIDGLWDYRFLLVETDGLVRDSIVLVDNR